MEDSGFREELRANIHKIVLQLTGCSDLRGYGGNLLSTRMEEIVDWALSRSSVRVTDSPAPLRGDSSTEETGECFCSDCLTNYGEFNDE